MQFGMRVEGLDQLARTLRRLPEAVEKKAMAAALRKGGEPIRGMAASLMARSADPPHAAENVRIQVGRSGFSASIGPTKDYFYWKFQELGTTRHPAQPALRPAFDSQAPTSLGIIGRELWAAVRGEAERQVGGSRFL